MINNENTCCFSGYRPEKLPWGVKESDERCNILKEKIYDALKQIYDSGIRHFICGMARGCDTYFCEAVLSLRAQFPGITLEAAIPYEAQSAKWLPEEQDRYDRLVYECDYRTYVNREYSSGCMKRRNRYMVNNASVLLTVFDGKTGGTMYTRNYATRKGLNVIEITP